MIICGWFIYFTIRGPKNSREKAQEEFKSQWIEIIVKCRLLDTTWLLHTSVHSSRSYPRKIKPVKIPAWVGGRPRSATLLQEHSAVDSCFRRERESPQKYGHGLAAHVPVGACIPMCIRAALIRPRELSITRKKPIKLGEKLGDRNQNKLKEGAYEI